MQTYKVQVGFTIGNYGSLEAASACAMKASGEKAYRDRVVQVVVAGDDVVAEFVNGEKVQG